MISGSFAKNDLQLEASYGFRHPVYIYASRLRDILKIQKVKLSGEAVFCSTFSCWGNFETLCVDSCNYVPLPLSTIYR